MLPQEWQGEAELPSEYFPYVLGAGLLWASFMTYYDLARKPGRSPKIIDNLQRFYISGQELQGRHVTSNIEMEKLKTDFAIWYREARTWIKLAYPVNAHDRYM